MTTSSRSLKQLQVLKWDLLRERARLRAKQSKTHRPASSNNFTTTTVTTIGSTRPAARVSSMCKMSREEYLERLTGIPNTLNTLERELKRIDAEIFVKTAFKGADRLVPKKVVTLDIIAEAEEE
ncbi:hypothetical protein HK102_009304 [Quaeritorhiza haematococci]|nr:hypothetical protein HK102_009304 [Quaeritorhiza haematococci]